MANELSASYGKALELHNKILVSAQLAQSNLWDMCAGLKEMRDGKLYKELGYSNFEEYCQTEFNINRTQAHKYISISENKNVYSSKHLGVTKLYLLSTLSESDQEKITAENDVESMTVRQLEAEVKALKEKNSVLQLDLDELAEEHERVCNTDNKTIDGLRQNISDLNQTIEELEARPVEVAVAEPAEDVRQLKETIKNLERTTERQLEDLQNQQLEDIRALHRKNDEETRRKLAEQKERYEKMLAEAAQPAADGKQVFKAYFTAAYDTFNRMLDYARQSPEKPFFREKIAKLITTLSTAAENL